MDKILRKIQEELTWLVKEQKATTNYLSSKHLQTLSYIIWYEKKKIKLMIEFVIMPKDESVSMKLVYEIKDQLRELHRFEYPFSKIRSKMLFPMIDSDDHQKVHDIMDFEIVEGEIIPTVSDLTKALIFTELIRKNIEKFLAFGKELREEQHLVFEE